MAETQYHTHISAKQKWLDLNLKEVWRYKDLIFLFGKRNFIVSYKQTILGPAWLFLTPLMSSIVQAFVFGEIAGIGTDGVPTYLFYLCSNAIWAYFSSCLTGNANTFTENSGVFGKVYFPRLVTPISNVISTIIRFGIQMILVLAFLLYFVVRGAVHPNWAAWIMIPVELIHMGILGMGCGIIISSLTTKYRDLSLLVTFGVQLWMYITPVVYPMSALGDGFAAAFVRLNPVTCAVEAFRWMFLGVGAMEPGQWGISVGVMAAVVLLGIMIFNRVEKTFMDTV